MELGCVCTKRWLRMKNGAADGGSLQGSIANPKVRLLWIGLAGSRQFLRMKPPWSLRVARHRAGMAAQTSPSEHVNMIMKASPPWRR